MKRREQQNLGILNLGQDGNIMFMLLKNIMMDQCLVRVNTLNIMGHANIVITTKIAKIYVKKRY